MIESLEEASIHREKALANLTEDERRFLFSHAQTIVEQFTPQISSVRHDHCTSESGSAFC